MRSDATTVEQYLRDLPEERRGPMTELVGFLRKSIPKGYREEMAFGMPAWVVPLEQYPDTYNKQPLNYVALASQKQCMSLYLSMSCRCVGLETEPFLRAAWEKAGKKLDMGRACLRFKKLEDLELDALKTVLASTPVETFIEEYEQVRATHTAGGRRQATKAKTATTPPAKTAAATKPAAKATAATKSAVKAKAATKPVATKPAAKTTPATKPVATRPAAKAKAATKPAAKAKTAKKPVAPVAKISTKPVATRPAAKTVTKPVATRPAAKAKAANPAAKAKAGARG